MRLTKIAVPAAAVALALSGASIASADPGPFGPNNFGLCTAYSSGSPNGQEHKHSAPPFAALAAAAAAESQTVAEWCAENGTHPGNGGGKPTS